MLHHLSDNTPFQWSCNYNFADTNYKANPTAKQDPQVEKIVFRIHITILPP